MNVLLILMWNHALVRKRRYIFTAAECLSTLLYFLILFAVKNLWKNAIKPEISVEEKNSEAKTDIVPINEIIPPPYRIIYYPATTHTNTLMDDVGKELNLKRLAFNSDRSESGFFPLGEGTRLADFAADMQMMEAIVTFQDMNGPSWPSKLNYTIRMMNAFHTETYESEDASGPNKNYGIEYGTFMRIQWVIDTTYIKKQGGERVKEVSLFRRSSSNASQGGGSKREAMALALQPPGFRPYWNLMAWHATMAKDWTKLSLQEFPYHYTYKYEAAAVLCKFLTNLCVLSLALTYVLLMMRLLKERTSGIQELIKMVGVSIHTLGLSHFLNVLPCGLIFAIGGTIILKVSNNPLVPQSDGVLVCLMLLLYFNTVVSMAFVLSYVSRRTQYADFLAILTYALLWFPLHLLSGRKMHYILRVAVGLLPHMPLESFWNEVFMLEGNGMGANFGNIGKSHSLYSVSNLINLITMLIQSVICYLLAWYLSQVRPGHYGQALPWYFICQALQKKKEVKPIVGAEEDHIVINPQYFEPPPARTEIGISVVNVSKAYPGHQALRHVSLDVYKGEITVLVGHNGAGKSTLMSIITGMTSATEGKVYVNGKDTVTEKSEVRKNISLCPQYNMFLEDLSVKEHIMFFTLLKGGTFNEARISARGLAERLGLSEKINSLPTELSGGMKRRTQLACALAGGSDVLVLDEPTSGLDVETRRELWDLLLSLRGNRTVLLSTHFMEEADALGNRMAALHDGVLRCYATTMHLKKAIGTGYRLSFTTFGVPKEEAISKVVMSHVPEATLKGKTKNSLTYNLPAIHSGKFPELFAALEDKRSKLGLDSIGVGVSTLEEVFLKVCSNVDTSYENEVDEMALGGPPEPPPKKLTGIPLYMRQMFVLLKRQFKFVVQQREVFVFGHFILPTMLIFATTNMANSKHESPQRSLAMDLKMYSEREDNRVLYHDDRPHVLESDVLKVKGHYPKVTFDKADDIADTMLKIGQKDILEYNKYLVGVEVKKDDAKVLYTTTVRHAAPVALNLLSNMLAAHYMSVSDGNTITTMNDPISRELYMYEETKQPKKLHDTYLWSLMLTYAILLTVADSIALACKERLTGTRHIHIMSGCPAEVHWLATLIFHTIIIGFLFVMIVIAAFALDKDDTINQADCLGALVVVLLLGSMALLALCFALSFNLSQESATVILLVLIIIFGLIIPIIETGQQMAQKTSGTLHYFISASYYIAIPHTMVATSLKCARLAHLNALCKLLRKHCPNLFIDEKGFDNAKCCAGENPRCYFCIDKYSPGIGMIVLSVQFLVMMTIVILLERRVFNGLVDKVLNLRYEPTRPAQEDKMVRAERAYVSRTINMPVKDIPDSMLVDDVHKNFVMPCKTNVNAVRGVSFSVKKGECFGLLGVNGAGKSTCFKMITGEESATRGNIFSNGYHLRRGHTQYLQTMGYCPQFFGLDMFQTGEENLALVLTLRGFDRQRVENEVRNWLHIVGLEKYARNIVEQYSGGCVRRLSAAAALCNSAHLALLDEPTAGVDVAARRRLWTAMRKAQRLQRAVIITSHSLDEIEALCSRIAIMSAGRVRALGSAAELRAAHAQGHAVVFKIAQAKGDGAGVQKELNRLKRRIKETFNCTLTDEHKTMLHYHINETMRYSDLFSELEFLREEFPIIEDYSVSETTLEEVFLSLAKEQDLTSGPHIV